MIETTIPSKDGKNSLHVVIWEPEDEIKAIVQISHGMLDYVERYEVLAEYLNQFGILVIGNDHLGHGKTAAESDLGYFGKGKSKTVVDDLDQITLYAKNAYGVKVPVFLFGQGMGSLFARRYIMEYGNDIDGVILSGTGYMPSATIVRERLITSVIKMFHGERYCSKFLENTIFGTYNKRIKNPHTVNDWLTKNKEVVDQYNQDKFCTFKFTVNGYQTLFEVLTYVQDITNIRRIPKTLPIFLCSGEEDPVGNYGKGVKKVFKKLATAGMQDLYMKVYPGARHELVNETQKSVIYPDIRGWLFSHMQRGDKTL